MVVVAVPVEVERKDPIALQDEAYKDGNNLSTQALADYLLRTLGERVATVAMGLTSARALRNWREGGKASVSNFGRLHLVYRIVYPIEQMYGPEAAQAFLIGTNPRLGASPLVVLKNEETDDELQITLLAVVRGFLES